MALTDSYTIGTNPAFVQRVTVAMLNAAVAITSESTTTADHTNRETLARAALLSPSQYGPMFALAVAANLALTPATLPGTTDAQVATSVSAVWNGFAGVA